MIPRHFCEIARRLMQHPAAPYHEHALRDEAERICAEHNLVSRRDASGNLLLQLRRKAAVRPLVLAAHLDHPGFEILKPLSRQVWLARFRGGVPDVYFRPATPLLLMPGRLPATLGRRRHKAKRLFEVESTSPAQVPPQFGVWDLKEFVVQHRRIYGRACDDLIGAAAVLATCIDLEESRARVDVIGVLSRAEEVGFHGALALADSGRLPGNSVILSLETSRELPGVQMGKGVILRVGDRASVFDPSASRFLAEVASDLRAKSSFVFQRGLMSGGTCEATAYQEFGYRSAAVCVALGNYHNCGTGRRIKEEYVSVADACSMVDLLGAAARQMPNWERSVARLPKRLHQSLSQARRLLRKTLLP